MAHQEIWPKKIMWTRRKAHFLLQMMTGLEWIKLFKRLSPFIFLCHINRLGILCLRNTRLSMWWSYWNAEVQQNQSRHVRYFWFAFYIGPAAWLLNSPPAMGCVTWQPHFLEWQGHCWRRALPHSGSFRWSNKCTDVCSSLLQQRNSVIVPLWQFQYSGQGRIYPKMLLLALQN